MLPFRIGSGICDVTMILDSGVLLLVMMIYVDTGQCFERYSTAYLQDSCTCSAIDHLRCEPFTLDPQAHGAGNVALSRTAHFYKEFFCQFTILAPSKRHRIMVTVNYMNIPKLKGCKAGMLKIYDGPLGETPAELTGLCGAEEPKFPFRSNTDRITLTYHQTMSILKHEKSFNLTFTYFRMISEGASCNNSREFPCVNGQCISRRLECDGWNNCGDKTDESMDYHVCGQLHASSDPMVGVAVGVSVASILVIVMATLVAYGVQRKKGPFFHDSTAMTAVRTSDENGNTHRSSRRRQSDTDSLEVDTSEPGLITIPLGAVGGSTVHDTRVNVLNNPLGNIELGAAARGINKPVLRIDLADDTHSVASSGDYAMGLHRDPPPPSYHSLFPDV